MKRGVDGSSSTGTKKNKAVVVKDDVAEEKRTTEEQQISLWAQQLKHVQKKLFNAVQYENQLQSKYAQVFQYMNHDVPLPEGEMEYSDQIVFLESDIQRAKDDLKPIIKEMKALVEKIDAAIVGWQTELNPIEEKRGDLLKKISLATEAKIGDPMLSYLDTMLEDVEED